MIYMQMIIPPCTLLDIAQQRPLRSETLHEYYYVNSTMGAKQNHVTLKDENPMGAWRSLSTHELNFKI